MKFNETQCNPLLLKSLDLLKYEEMFPVQERAWAILNAKKDCIIHSKTGSGKTIAYAFPILENIVVNNKSPQVLILCPTRELAKQVKKVFDDLGTFLSLKSILLVGKTSYDFQKQDLNQRCHVVVGTPGRVVEHVKEGNLKLDSISYFVMDEADELLNPDFEKDIVVLKERLGEMITTCLVSATVSSNMERFVRNPERIEQDVVNKQIEAFALKIQEDRFETCVQILNTYVPESCLIFVTTQQDVIDLSQKLIERHISCSFIHGGMEQEKRFAHMSAFKKGDIRVLVATDVAGRGIDIERVDLILNYDLPKSKTIYIHRIGRSGRALEVGCAISLFADDQEEYVDTVLEIEKKNIALVKTFDKSLSVSTKIVKEKDIDLKKEVSTLFINGGKDKKIRPGDIVGAFCRVEGIVIEDIGAIRVEAHQSFVDIYNKKEMIILKSVKKIKSKNVRIERAKRDRNG